MGRAMDRKIVLSSMHQEYLGKGGQKTNCFNYRADLTVEELLEEMKSQPHLKPLLSALSPERRLYLLKGDREELMQLAAEYIGNYHRLQDGAEYEDVLIECEDDCGENWDEDEAIVTEGDTFSFDFSKKLPVINSHDLLFRDSDPEFYPVGGMGFGMNRRSSPRPWWTYAEDAPLCIRLTAHGPISELYNRLEEMSDRSLLILWQTVSKESAPAYINEEFEDYRDRRLDELAFQLECEPICLSAPEKTSLYKQQILRQMARERGVCLSGRDTAKAVLHLVQESRKDVDNSTLNKVIGNALVRRKKGAPKRLALRDFSFLKDMVVEQAQSAQTQNNLIGQEKVKSQLDSIVDQLAFQRRRGELDLPTDNIHKVMAFMGAPGTGKTSWAKYLAQRMESLRLLDNTEMICVNAAELKAKYVGHTTARVKAIFENYGVIILDEAYSLAESGGETDSFSREALAQLCVELENHGQDRLVIFAGYGGSKNREDNPMARFMEANPGISSRISFKVFFDDFQPGQLVEVFHSMLKTGGYDAPHDADGDLERYFRLRKGARAFGNCREARNLADRAKSLMASRLMRSESLNREQACRLTAEDIRSAVNEVLSEYDSLQSDRAAAVGF